MTKPLSNLEKETQDRIREFICRSIKRPVSPKCAAFLKKVSTARYLSNIHSLLVELGISRKLNEFHDNFLNIEYIGDMVSVITATKDKYLSYFDGKPVVISNFDMCVKIINIVAEIVAEETLGGRKPSFQLKVATAVNSKNVLEYYYQVHMHINSHNGEKLATEQFNFESDEETATSFYNHCLKLGALKV